MEQGKIIYPFAPDLQISPLSSLNFEHDWRRDFQTPCHYEQKFVRWDRIRVQYAATHRYSFKACITDNDTGQTSVLSPTELKTFENSEQGTQGKVYEVLLNELAPGSYTFDIYIALTSDRLVARSSFRVVSGREEGTVRITYNHRRDEFDTVFGPERMFDFRVEGCFLPSESSFAVDSEGFRDQSDRYKQLSALPYRKDIFSVGGGFGVPNWVADKLNYIFSTSFVLIDEMKYSRSESAVPEMTSIHGDYPMYLYKIELEKDRHFQYEGRYGGDFNFDYNQDYNTVRYDI